LFLSFLTLFLKEIAMDTTKPTIKKKAAPSAKFKSTAIMVPGTLQTRSKKLSEATAKTLLFNQSKMNLTQPMDDVSQESLPNGQVIPTQVSDEFPSTQESSASAFDMSLHSDMPEWVLSIQKQVRDMSSRLSDQESRLFSLESLTAENLHLKQSLQDAQDKIALLESRLAQRHHHSPASDLNVVQEDVDVDMVAEASFPALPSRDLSSNGSKYATVPVPAPKKTIAQIVASSTKVPSSKQTMSLKKKMAIGRAFMSAPPGPQGFKYVYIPRSRKLTRVEVRSRLRKIGVDTSRVLDIIFPAAGTVGVLLHIQYVKSFTSIMTSIGAKTLDSFDVLDPVHLGDPKYLSYTEDGRATKAMELHANRCLSALTYLHRTKSHQVQPVGRSFIDLGWITDSELLEVLALPKDSSAEVKTVSRPGDVFVQEQDDQEMGEGVEEDTGDSGDNTMDQDAKSIASESSY
jgi:hypothetical protein